jgi:hypothetical protein
MGSLYYDEPPLMAQSLGELILRKNHKKLSLHKETLLDLDLQAVIGGGTTGSLNCSTTCNTCNTCDVSSGRSGCPDPH